MVKKEELLKIAKPILFNTDMVMAVLNGRKTVTRRVVKFLPGENPIWTGYIKDGLMLYNGKNEPCCRKPLYQAGDILYVRETWSEWTGGYLYKAWPDGLHQPGAGGLFNWKPSIHMPKEAARIFLKVTGVRIERLKDITSAEAEKEGVGELFLEDIACGTKDYGNPVDEEYGVAKEQFAFLWDSTIHKDNLHIYGWKANPWVWVIEFEKVMEVERYE